MGLRSGIGVAAVSLAMFVGAASSSAAAEKRLALSSSAADLGAWNARVEQMLGAGTLAVTRTEADSMVSGREHQRLAQLYKGVPVWGGDLVRQMGPQGAISLFGTLHEGIDIDVTPKLSAREAEAAVAKRGASLTGDEPGPQLVIYPRTVGGYVLAYRVRALLSDGKSFDIRVYFIDAATGVVAHSYSDLQSQSVPGSAVGTGTGVINDRKKLSVRSQGSSFNAADLLRPARVLTYDYKGELFRVLGILSAPTFQSFVAGFVDADLASDSDNTWTDPAVVDAHAYSGYVYDYYFKRFGRRGIDGANIAIRSITHPVNRSDLFIQPPDIQSDFYLNAFYLGAAVMMYGEGLPTGVRLTNGQYVDYWSGALDVVGHELTHGVTDYTSGLIYENESGALNESFSDMIGTAIEFYFQPTRADYLVAEDIFTPGGIRSMRNPNSFGDPDHYSIRFTGPEDNGGVHINSGIPNHVFYLAIEGGVHRLSGVAVQGVGAANREQIEKVIYRAFTLLPAGANFSTARAATIQSARDLYASNPAVERAITQAWTAVGVN